MEASSAAAVEPEVISSDEVADLVQPLPDVNAAAIDAAHEQEAQAQAEEAQANAPTPPPAAAAAPLPASAAAKPAPAPGRSRVAVTDEKGRAFNPLLHECTEDGQPIMRSAPNDRYVRCRRQPLKEWKRKSVVADDQPAQPVEAPSAPVVDTAKQMVAAQTMAGLQLMAMRVALGEKVGQAEAERTELCNCWFEVMRHYGIGGSFHPLVGLALCSGTIVIGALHHEDTRGRLTKLWHWAQHKALSVWQSVRGGKRTSKPQQAQEREPERAAA